MSTLVVSKPQAKRLKRNIEKASGTPQETKPAMSADEVRAIEMTGGSVNTLAEALDQWDAERQALQELFDENQALVISFRFYDATMTLAETIVNDVEKESAMFMSEKTRDKIKKFRQQLMNVWARRAQGREIVVDANERRARAGTADRGDAAGE